MYDFPFQLIALDATQIRNQNFSYGKGLNLKLKSYVFKNVF